MHPHPHRFSMIILHDIAFSDEDIDDNNDDGSSDDDEDNANDDNDNDDEHNTEHPRISITGYVCRSIGWSVGRSVGNAFAKTSEIQYR